jgi:DegV family protein with EDD domain
MSDYVLSCCSPVDLTPAWLEERSIRSVPFNYVLDGVWHKDDFGKTIAPKELYRRMLAGEDASTSQVGVGDYTTYFRSMLDQGLDVVHVTLSGGLSSTYNSAHIAAESLKDEYPDRTIYLVDSLCASAGYGLLMDRMAELKAEGMDAATLAAWAKEHRLEVNHLFCSGDLTFFVKGGRISPIAGKVGGMLKICPLMHVATDGSLQVKEKIRTKHKTKLRTVERMAQLAAGGTGYDQRVFISHADCLDDAREVADLITQQFPNVRDHEVHLFDIGATIGVHTGPGTVALFFWGDPQRW